MNIRYHKCFHICFSFLPATTVEIPSVKPAPTPHTFILILLSGSDDLRCHLPKSFLPVLIPVRIDTAVVNAIDKAVHLQHDPTDTFHILAFCAVDNFIFSGSDFSKSELQQIVNNFSDFRLFVSCPTVPGFSGRCPDTILPPPVCFLYCHINFLSGIFVCSTLMLLLYIVLSFQPVHFYIKK